MQMGLKAKWAQASITMNVACLQRLGRHGNHPQAAATASWELPQAAMAVAVARGWGIGSADHLQTLPVVSVVRGDGVVGGDHPLTT